MDNFIGEIRVFSAGKIPTGWVACNGQTMQITQNAALYALLGTNFGGDGKTTFNLPDLRGRAMIGYGTSGGVNYQIGNKAGVETVTLTTSMIPMHIHMMQAASVNGTQPLNNQDDNLAIITVPTGTPATQQPINAYIPSTSQPVTMHPNTVESTGGSQPHENRMPLQALNVCIAVQGVFPPRD